MNIEEFKQKLSELTKLHGPVEGIKQAKLFVNGNPVLDENGAEVQVDMLDCVTAAPEAQPENDPEKSNKETIMEKSIQDSISEQVAAQVKAAVEEFTKSQSKVEDIVKVTSVPATAKRYGKIKNFRGPDADVKAYKFGRQLMAIAGHEESQDWCKSHGISVTHGKVSNTVNAGALVPEDITTDIIDLKNEYGVFSKYARLEPMASDTKSIPRRTGGLTAYFVNESGAGTQSTMGWNSVGLVAKKVMVLTKITSEVQESAILNMADTCLGEMVLAISTKEDDCGFNGDGTQTYGGIVGIRSALTNTFTVTNATAGGIACGAGNAYSELTLANFNETKSLLPEYARKLGTPRWYMSPTVWYGVVERLVAAAGGVTPADLASGAVPKLLGDEVILCNSMPSTAANSQLAVAYGALELAAVFGERRMVTLAQSDSALNSFEQDEICLKCTSRFDVVVNDVGSGTTPGPIVGLQLLNA